MYDFLKGTVVECQPGQVTLDVGGIGFKLITSDQTSTAMGEEREEVLLVWRCIFSQVLVPKS